MSGADQVGNDDEDELSRLFRGAFQLEYVTNEAQRAITRVTVDHHEQPSLTCTLASDEEYLKRDDEYFSRALQLVAPAFEVHPVDGGEGLLYVFRREGH